MVPLANIAGTVGPLVRLRRGALRLARRVRQREDDRPRRSAAHICLHDSAAVERPGHRGRGADQQRAPRRRVLTPLTDVGSKFLSFGREHALQRRPRRRERRLVRGESVPLSAGRPSYDQPFAVARARHFSQRVFPRDAVLHERIQLAASPRRRSPAPRRRTARVCSLSGAAVRFPSSGDSKRPADAPATVTAAVPWMSSLITKVAQAARLLSNSASRFGTRFAGRNPPKCTIKTFSPVPTRVIDVHESRPASRSYAAPRSRRAAVSNPRRADRPVSVSLFVPASNVHRKQPLRS